MDPVHIFTPYLKSILILSSHERLDPPNGLLALIFPAKILYAIRMPSMSTTRLVYLISIWSQNNI